VAAGFRVRRITSGQSIGDKLKRTRIRKKISIAEVEEATKIRAKFILALESDSWEQIPSEVYGRGYLERYAAFLQLGVAGIMEQYDRERQLYARRCQDSQVELAPKSTVTLPRFLLTPRLMVGSFVAIVLVVFLGGVGYQLKKFTAAPYLQLVTPAHAEESNGTELVVGTNSVTVTGKTTPDATVSVNGVAAEVNDDGSFSQPVAVQKGVNSIVVEAINSKGKSTSEVLSVIVK